jgi:PAS domain S-box-containing protein
MVDGPRGNLAPSERGNDAPGVGPPARVQITSAEPTEDAYQIGKLVIGGVVVLAVIGAGLSVVVMLFANDQDRRGLVTLLLGFIGPVIGGLMALLTNVVLRVLRNIHQAINGRLTQLLESRTLEARATGRLEGSQAEQARGIVNAADVAIWSKLLDGTITSWNPAAERLLGWSEHEVLGHSVYDYIPEGEHERERDVLKRLAAGERIDRWIASRVTKDGGAVRLVMQLSPIRNIKGEIVSVSTMARPDEQKAPAAAGR